MQTAIAIIFALFVLCFIAIVIEESFLAGRRRRKLLQKLRERRSNDDST